MRSAANRLPVCSTWALKNQPIIFQISEMSTDPKLGMIMLSKRERFERWRGVKSRNEQGIYDTTVLIKDYLVSVDNLSQIKRDFADASTEQFNKLNVYGWRGFGAVAYCKFIVEETTDLLPVSATEQIALLSEFNDILADVFDSPRKNPVHNSTRMIEIVKQILTWNIEDVTHLKQARILCFTLYYIITLLYASIESLSDWKRIAINAFVDLEKIRENTVELLRLAEEKTRVLDVALQEEQLKESLCHHEITVQDYFNDRISALFNPGEREDRLFIKLRSCLEDISDGLTAVKAGRTKHQVTTLNSQKLQDFLAELIANELKVVGRKYFLDLIYSCRESFELLMDLAGGFKKDQADQLALNINKLKAPGIMQSISSNVLYGMSWATSLITIAYRALFSLLIQDSIEKITPPTLDSQCKADLNDLVRECIRGLDRQLIDEQHQINESTLQLAKKNMELKKLIEQESDEQLDTLLRANHEIGEALSKYRRISFTLKQKGFFLAQFKETYTVLRVFIDTHDGWMIKLSNFFAQFASWFKTDTARLVDSARELSMKLVAFESEYRNDVSKGMDILLTNPFLPVVVKNQFMDEFVRAKDKEASNLVCAAQNKEEIRDLLYNTSLFFNQGETQRVIDKRLRTDSKEFYGEVDIEKTTVLRAIGI